MSVFSNSDHPELAFDLNEPTRADEQEMQDDSQEDEGDDDEGYEGEDEGEDEGDDEAEEEAKDEADVDETMSVHAVCLKSFPGSPCLALLV